MIYICMNVFVMMECKKKLPFWVTLPSVVLGKGRLSRAQWSQHSAIYLIPNKGYKCIRWWQSYI